jgi:hypothetical protein
VWIDPAPGATVSRIGEQLAFLVRPRPGSSTGQSSRRRSRSWIGRSSKAALPTQSARVERSRLTLARMNLGLAVGMR